LSIRICVSILPKNFAEAARMIERAEEEQADLIEVRLEIIEAKTNIADLAAFGRTPKIATDRKEAITKMDPQQILLQAAKNGFEYVDIDVYTPNLKENVRELINFGAKPIISFHNHMGTCNEAELERILEKEMSNRAEICKIVTTAKTFEDNLSLLHFTSIASRKTKLACFAMGEKGKISRLLSPLFGAFFTFAALERGNETAPGQMTIREMRTAYELLELKTKR
jgi:3-dehydroquinate dehydratase type I